MYSFLPLTIFTLTTTGIRGLQLLPTAVGEQLIVSLLRKHNPFDILNILYTLYTARNIADITDLQQDIVDNCPSVIFKIVAGELQHNLGTITVGTITTSQFLGRTFYLENINI